MRRSSFPRSWITFLASSRKWQIRGGTRAIAGRILLPEFHRDTEMRVLLGHVTRMSRQRLASGIDHEIETDCPLTIEHRSGEEEGRVIFSVEATEGKPIRLVKFMTYHNSRSAGCT